MSKDKSVVAAGHELDRVGRGGNPRRRRQRLRRRAGRHVHDLRRRGGVRLAGRRRLPHGAAGRQRPRPRCSTSSSRRRCKRRAESEVSFFPIHADFGPAKQEFHIGLGSSATPGMVPGLFAIHEALCRLPMKRLVEPAVRAARAGFPLTAFQAYLFTVIAPILTASPERRAHLRAGRQADDGRRDVPQRRACRHA